METQIVANYTISPPSRRLLNKKIEIRKNADQDDEEELTATFTIAPSPTSKTTTFKILSDENESKLEEPITASITATINVPIPKDKKTESPPTSPQHQKLASVVQEHSFFDNDNIASSKSSDHENNKCDNESRESSVDSTAISDTNNTVFDDKNNSPPSSANLNERRPSWRLKTDLGKVNFLNPPRLNVLCSFFCCRTF